MHRLRSLHIALCLGAAIILAVFGGIGFLTTTRITSSSGVVGVVVLGLCASMLIAGAVLRTTIPQAESSTGDETWATTNLQRCVLFWAVLEGGVSLCGIAIFLGASPWIAGALAAVGLGFLASQSPGTLAGH